MFGSIPNVCNLGHNYNVVSFKIENISRHLLWAISSKVKLSNVIFIRQFPESPNDFYTPSNLNSQQYKLYTNAILRTLQDYEELNLHLYKIIEKEYLERFIHRKGSPKSQIDIHNIVLGITQYVLPRSSTVSVQFDITIDDLITICDLCSDVEFAQEARLVIFDMAKNIIPLENILNQENININIAENCRTTSGFDKFVASGPYTSAKLLSVQPDNSNINFLMATTMGIGINPLDFYDFEKSLKDRTFKAMEQIRYQFAIKTSLLADEFMNLNKFKIKKLFPSLLCLIGDKDNYHIPWPIENDNCLSKYILSVETSIVNATDLLNTTPSGLYLMPNSWILRNIYSIDLPTHINVCRQAMCMSSMKELWQLYRQLSIETIKVHPQIKSHLMPPCHHKKNGPPCPYKLSYCGNQIWKENVFAPDFKRTY